MKEVIKTILYSDVGSTLNNVGLLGFRVLLAIELFRVHGLKKFKVGEGQKEHVPNPFKLPEKVNAAMCYGYWVFCGPSERFGGGAGCSLHVHAFVPAAICFWIWYFFAGQFVL